MRVEITEGRKAMATVRHPDWSVTVHATGTVSLSAWCGRAGRRMRASFIGESVTDLVRAWQGVRDALGGEPLEQDLLDAVSAARRELQRHDGYSEVRPRSRFERFAEDVGDGTDPDEAARAVGGTGRPERSPSIEQAVAGRE